MWKNLFLPNHDRTSAGSPEILGATPADNGEGINFAIFSEHARRVQLLIFENPLQSEPTFKYDLNPWKNKTGHIWHVFVRGISDQATYAYRVAGSRRKEFRFDFKKVLLDPYAKAIDYRYYDRAIACGNADNLRSSLRGKIVTQGDHEFDWRGTESPKHLPHELIIYELHPKGFTANKNCSAQTSGYFTRIKEKISHLKSLGINAIELLPIQAFDNDQLIQNDWGDSLINYWGYTPINFFSLHQAYFSTQNTKDQFRELKELVRACHSQGISVIMDVVYNHTTEGNHLGPTLSFRGIDNANYYITSPDDRSYYMDFTGCGHTFNANHPQVTDFILATLEYFVSEFKIDGFRFDLAACFYYNEDGYFMANPPIIKRLNQSEILANTIFIAEPWTATGTNLLGSFGGNRWLEWNGEFRDLTRKLINHGDTDNLTDWSESFWGNTAQFLPEKSQLNSINFITCHDGFTLHDLVSYDYKHNEANGYDSTDGADQNHSNNSGVEGYTNLPEVLSRRSRQMKNFLLLLILSRGAIMMSMGDEIARTQNGNNNAFNQDNELSYFNWDLVKKNNYLLEFTSNLIKFRSKYKLSQFLAAELADMTTNNFDLNFSNDVIIIIRKINKHQQLCLIINHTSDPQWAHLKNSSSKAVTIVKEAPSKNNIVDRFGEIDADIDHSIESEKDQTEKANSLPKWRQIIDTNNLSPTDFTPFDLAEEITNSQLFVAPQSIKVLINDTRVN